MIRQIVIEIHRLPHAQVRGNSHGSWQARSPLTKMERQAGYEYALEALQGREDDDFPWMAVSIHFDFYNAAWVDWANLARGVKPWEDGIITDAGICPDDSPRYVKSFSMSFTKMPHRKDAKTIITITKLEKE